MPIEKYLNLGYRDVYDDFNETSIEELLRGIPSYSALEIIGYFLANIHLNSIDRAKQLDFVNLWLNRLNESDKTRVYDAIKKLEKYGSFIFISNVSGLILLQEIFKNFNPIKSKNDITKEQELALLKAYLYCTQIWVDKPMGKKELNSNKMDTLIGKFVISKIPYDELHSYKDFTVQFVKAIRFFNFCTNDLVFSDFLKPFLAFYECSKWEDYLINLMSLYSRDFEYQKTPSIIDFQGKPENDNIKAFLDKLSLRVEQFEASDDFTFLRKYPILKLNDNQYLFYNLNFFVDKFYQGIQFDIFKHLKENRIKIKGKEIKEFDHFRSIYADTFAEKGLFYDTLDYCFSNNKYELLRGEEMKAKGIIGGPDFLIKQKNKIYIFEFKDVILNAKTKHSYDIDLILQEIEKKFVLNEENSPKGVSQIINTINKLKNGDFSKVKIEYNPKFIIYPIIVITDNSFSVSGINYYLNNRFNELLEEKSIQNANIKGLCVISLDTLILYQDEFKRNEIALNYCINGFLDHISTMDYTEKIIPFDVFIQRKLRRPTPNHNSYMMKEAKKILPE